MICKKHNYEYECKCPICLEYDTIKVLRPYNLEAFEAGFKREYKKTTSHEERRAWQRGRYWGALCESVK